MCFQSVPLIFLSSVVLFKPVDCITMSSLTQLVLLDLSVGMGKVATVEISCVYCAGCVDG